MRITGTAIKLGAFALVLLMFTAIIIVVFGQLRFDRTTGYTAIFKNVSGLRSGQFVRASGVEVGKVSNVELIDGHRLEKQIPGFDAFMNGKALANAAEKLDYIAEQNSVRPLMSFFSSSRSRCWRFPVVRASKPKTRSPRLGLSPRKGCER